VGRQNNNYWMKNSLVGLTRGEGDEESEEGKWMEAMISWGKDDSARICFT